MSLFRSVLSEVGTQVSEFAQKPTTQGAVGGAAGVYSIWQNVASFSAQLAAVLGAIMTVWAFVRWCRDRCREYKDSRNQDKPTL